jgi:putative DNA methylase
MTWDYAEANPLSNAGGGYILTLQSLAEVLERLPRDVIGGSVRQQDARSRIDGTRNPLLVTDPPYYDNIGYADLSDFFYVWLRRCVGEMYPELFSTVLTPKSEELVAAVHRFDGSRERAWRYFEEGLERVFEILRRSATAEYPLALLYAFKQTETEAVAGSTGSGSSSIVSTGWEAMLESLVRARFTVAGTWPVRSELTGSLKKTIGALASSIVLVCRPRPEDAPVTTRREFLGALKRELPLALKNLQHGNIAPVDLAQAAIGPGMAVFSRYSKVLEQDGSPMRVRTALALINQVLDEVLAEQEGEFDADTRWAVAWFEQHAMEPGPYGVAETLSKAKNTSVQGMVNAGILEARAGKARLRRREELPADWDPASDARRTVWEVTQHLIRALMVEGSEEKAARILQRVGAAGEAARDLAYRLYGVCERKRWAQEALAYNSLVVAWPALRDLASSLPPTGATAPQGRLEM